MPGRQESFFHGTVHDIGVGRHVLPGNKSGRSNWGEHGFAGQKSSEHAFATESEDVAWNFAEMAGRLKRHEQISAGGPVPDRARVYKVAPHSQMRPGVFHAAHPQHANEADDLREWVAPKFRTTEQIDIKPGHQGTFPQLNWNQFSRASSVDHVADWNHPSPHTIKYELNKRFNKRPKTPQPTVNAQQMDLFTGKTTGQHAETDEGALGNYHRDNLFGRL